MTELTHHLIVYIVQNLHKNLLKTNLLKLLYLIDLEFFKKRGKQATNFNYIYYKKGPWTPQFDQTLTQLEGFEIKSIKKEKLEATEEYYIFCKGPKPRFQPALPSDLKEIVDRILFIFKETPQKDLLQYVYSIEPMRSVRFGEKIDFSRIFPQPPVDLEIEQTVSEANKEYESTNFPKILNSWIREGTEDFYMGRMAPHQGDSVEVVYSCPPAYIPRRSFPVTLNSLVKKGISLSEEILRDREES
jgi:hypothetical protein